VKPVSITSRQRYKNKETLQQMNSNQRLVLLRQVLNNPIFDHYLIMKVLKRLRASTKRLIGNKTINKIIYAPVFLVFRYVFASLQI
jgi:hypothetical protein